jgi:hypothetical protein
VGEINEDEPLQNQRCVVFGFDKLPDPVGVPLTLTERAACTTRNAAA